MTGGGSAPAGAQPAATDAYSRWLAPAAAEQVRADDTPVPAGSGAILVPALSDGALEPEVLVYRDGQQTAAGPTGRRIVVAPGSYRVRVGSGPTALMVQEDVTVVAGATATVAVRRGGPRVTVVDANDIPHRGSYELSAPATGNRSPSASARTRCRASRSRPP